MMKPRILLIGTSIGLLLVTTVLGWIRISQGQELALADSPETAQNPAVNGHIVYIADSRIDANSPLAARNVDAQIGAQHAETWADVLDAQTQAPIDALMIHSMVLDKVDRQWVREAYNDGVIMALVDFTHQTAGEFLNDPCLGVVRPPAASGIEIILTYRITVGDNLDDVQRVKDGHLAGKCGGGIEGVTTYVATSSSSHRYQIQGNAGLADLAEGLNQFMADRAEYVRLYESGELQGGPPIDPPLGGD